jgi:hypothetical protein
MRVADIILEQLGGNKFVVMTGASHFISDGNVLKMTLPRNASNANRLDITLDWDDTYTMRFYKYSPRRLNTKTFEFSQEKIKEVKTIQGVYCDMLQEIFTDVTHLYTRLF